MSLLFEFSLLPIGLAQTVASVEHGLWYARSAEFLQQPWIENLRWLRLIGDTLFLLGVGSFTWFMLGLRTGWSLAPESTLPPPAATPRRKPAERELVGAAK